MYLHTVLKFKNDQRSLENDQRSLEKRSKIAWKRSKIASKTITDRVLSIQTANMADETWKVETSLIFQTVTLDAPAAELPPLPSSLTAAAAPDVVGGPPGFTFCAISTMEFSNFRRRDERRLTDLITAGRRRCRCSASASGLALAFMSKSKIKKTQGVHVLHIKEKTLRFLYDRTLIFNFLILLIIFLHKNHII